MECNQENLQMYLDGEMDARERHELEDHLGSCHHCRQEMGRLKLLWLELGQVSDMEIPSELAYIRQQVISQAIKNRNESEDQAGYWQAQKLAWQPALVGASHFPGVGLLSNIGRAAVRQGPKLMSGTAALTGRLILTSRDKNGGSR